MESVHLPVAATFPALVVTFAGHPVSLAVSLPPGGVFSEQEDLARPRAGQLRPPSLPRHPLEKLASTCRSSATCGATATF